MHLLFVCTGNTCRSPMAEQIARDALKRRGLDWTVGSAGVYAVPGHEMSPQATVALGELGVQVTPHKSQPVTPVLMDEADLVLTMTGSHAWDLRATYPLHFEKIHELGVYATTENNPLSATCDIVDPFGGNVEDYKACSRQLRAFIERTLDKVERWMASGGY